MKILSKLTRLIWLVVLLAITALASPVVASGFSPALMLFPYDGQNQAGASYDGGFLSVFGYDTAVVSTAPEAHQTAGASDLFGKSAEFLAAEGGTASARRWVFQAGTPDAVIDKATADAIASLDRVSSEYGTTGECGGASKTGDNLGWTSWRFNTVSLYDGADVTTLMEEAHHAETAADLGYLGDVPESAAQAAARNAKLEASWEEYANSIGLIKLH